ncbi:MAG: PocR ligand-binding domain-containing protein, partial [Candidatus Sumerlaeota bacterium]
MLLPEYCTILLYMQIEGMIYIPERNPDGAEKPLEQALLDAEALLDVCITVYDLTGIFHDPAGQSLLGPDRQSHRRRSALCGIAFGGRKCENHCRGSVNQWAADHSRGFVHRCWKGLLEVAVPIDREGVHIATVLAGQWRDPDLNLGAIGRFPKKWQAVWAEAPLYDPERTERILHVLRALGQGLLSLVDTQFDLDGPAETRRLQILRFLKYHATTRVRLEDLARALHLSPSRTSHLVREELGESFQDLLKAERIQR